MIYSPKKSSRSYPIKSYFLLVTILAWSLFISTIPAGTSSGPGHSGYPEPTAQVQITNSEGAAQVAYQQTFDNSVILDFEVEGVQREETYVGEEIFQILSIPNYATTSDIGKPQLPILRELVGIPDGATVQVTIVDASYTTFTGYHIYPFQKPLKDSEQVNPDDFSIDRTFYSQDTFYPSELIEVEEPGIWRDITVVGVQVHPVLFNPATGELQVYDHIRVALEFSGGISAAKTISPTFGGMYKDNIINYDSLNITEKYLNRDELLEITGEIPPPIDLPVGIAEEVIGIAGTPYETDKRMMYIRDSANTNLSTLLPLLEWHRAEGYNWLGYAYSSRTSTEIKNLINSVYASHPELEYVLIVGDIDSLDWKDNWDGGAPPDDLPGDHWYACITGGATPDVYPDVAVGRLSVNNNTELSQLVTKTLTYAKNPPIGTWANQALLVCYDRWDYEDDSEDIRTTAYTDPFDFITAYGSDTGVDNAFVNTEINNGVGIIHYRGHGCFGDPNPRPWGSYWAAQDSDANLYGWNTYDEVYSTANAHALTNGNMMPIVMSSSCMNNALDNGTSGECLGEAFVKQTDGAVAFLGASRPSYTYANRKFCRYLFDAIGNESISRLGWIFNDANTEVIDFYGTGHMYMDNVKIYLWQGDPAVDLWTAQPDTLTVTHPPSVSNGVMTVTVKDGGVNVPDALVSIYKSGDIYDYKYTNALGQVTFNFIPSSSGTMDVTATKHNYVPYEGSVSVSTFTNSFSNISFSPTSPSSLDFDDRVYAYFDYTTDDTNGIQIFIRPFTNGSLTPNYAAHGSPIWPWPSGSGVSGWFTITSGDVVVDEVRFRIKSATTGVVLLDIFEPVDFTYGHSVHNITMNPPSPQNLKWGDQVNVDFDYFTCDDGYIFILPFTGGSPTPGFAVSDGSACSVGRGSGSGHFTINSGQVTVDQLRVKMTNTSQTITYIETFIPVNYYFEGDPEISVNPTAINVSMPTWDIWRGSFNIYNTGNGWLYYDMRDREDTDMDITREGISSTAPTTNSESPDKDGGDIPQDSPGAFDYEFDGTLMYLGGVSIAYDLTHNEKNDAQMDGMKDALASRGVTIEYINTGPITESLLEPYDILWINEDWTETTPWTTAEQTAVQNWVAKGRGLLIYGDEPGEASVLAGLFGITYTGTSGSGGYSTNIFTHDITEDVSQVYLQNPGNSLSVSSPGNTIINDDGGNPSVAATEYGQGRVVVMAEDYFWGPYLEYGDNKLMANQAFDWLVPAESSWLSVSPTTGTVPTSGTNWDEITVDIDTTGMAPGEYYADITITNDDPDENPTIVPVHLTVLPARKELTVAVLRSWGIASAFTELNDNWFAYGDTKLIIDTSLVYDAELTYEDLAATGADVLWISNPGGGSEQYTQQEIEAVESYANEGHSVLGTYKVFQHSGTDNRALAPIFGLLDNIDYNTAATTASLSFDILIEYPIFNNVSSPYASDGYPQAQVPDDDSSWDAGDLGEALLLAQTSSDNRGVITWYETPQYHAVFVSEFVEYTGNTDDNQFLYNTLTLPGPQVSRNLILHANHENYAEDVKLKIKNSGRLDGHLYVYDAASKTPSLETLKFYDAALVYSNSPDFDDPAVMGDNLADYVDQGGGVVTMTFTTNSAFALKGRWESDGYDPIVPTGQTSGSHLTLGTIHDSDHPVLDDVASFDGGSSSYHGTGALNADATLIAEWSNGDPLIVEMHKFVGRVLTLDFFPPSSDARSDFWDASTDGDILMANALNYVHQGMLTTIFGGTNSMNGAMFDLTAINFIDITGFDYSLDTAGTPGTNQTIEVYYVTNKTSFQGKEDDASAWTLLGQQTVTTAPFSFPTHVDIGGLSIMPGETVGIYITNNNTTDRMTYTNGWDTYSNGDLIFEGGTGKRYLFSTNYSPRIWNGTVYYSTAGPVSEYYLTAGNQDNIHVLQGSNVKRTFSQTIGDEWGIAAGRTVRTLGIYENDLGAEYLTNGTPTGATYTHSVPGVRIYDGAMDGIYNYAWDFENGAAYRFDLDWENPELLFTLGNDDGYRLGITYDPINHSLWISSWSDSLIENYSMSGTLLNSFVVSHSANAALALDPADGTLWLHDGLNFGTFEQYSRNGILLNTQIYSSLSSVNMLGGEFAMMSRNRADLTGEGCVSLLDLAIFSQQFLNIGCAWPADLTGDDCLVNLLDYAIFANEWQQCGSSLYNYDFYVDAVKGSDSNPGTRQEPFKTITHALNVAGEDEEIKVLPGTYDAANGETFPLVMKPGQSLVGDATNKGAGPMPTIISGRGSHVVGNFDHATIRGAEGSKILGFSIAAGTLISNHAAIVAHGEAAQIFNNTFQSNNYCGVFLYNDSASVVEQNIFDTSSFGVEVWNCSNEPVIKNNSFISGGSPIFVTQSASNPIISNNIIIGSGDYGIYVAYGTPRIENNTFDRPSGYSYGAIYCVTTTARPIVRGNTFKCSNAINNVFGVPDLGTDLTTDPGNNDFSLVTGFCVKHNGATDISAVGNTWPISIPLFGTHIVHTGAGDVVWWQQISSGNVNINQSSGYDFSAGTPGGVSHGDFYYYTAGGVPYEFFANNTGQQGLVDVGTSVSLNRVQIPTTGYYRFGVPAVKGNSFVSLAEIGEDNHYIIFDCDGFDSSYVEVTYIYIRIQ